MSLVTKELLDEITEFILNKSSGYLKVAVRQLEAKYEYLDDLWMLCVTSEIIDSKDYGRYVRFTIEDYISGADIAVEFSSENLISTHFKI